ncbi:sensor histidine kinase [uncultured Clostridium sp.]|uniref:sensor histidine kinase n=1 Tax=uncultured Clostridium sp. TaxID=59620 RepID=UPI0025E7B2EC|nr:GHKL domain-containing protein [uncultured Clostridium sp.]MDU4883290.1 GHKL domain-containing protein [Clostridium celatum]MDU7076363.1 GHKL domain-containing protein [Clostridium celatum]
MLIMYHIIFDEENSNIKIYTIYSILGGGIASIILMIFNKYPVLTFVLIFLLANIIVGKLYNKNIIVNIVGLIISCMTIIFIELVAMLISILIFGHNDLPYWAYFIILLLSMSSIIYSTYKVMKSRKINLENFIERYNSVVLISINLIIIFLLFKVLLQNEFIKDLEVVEIGALFLSMIIINTFYFISIYKNDKENKKSELKQSINPLIQELLDEMKASEHEYKNHLNILYCMIQVCKEDELKDRAKKYIGNVFENKNLLNNLSYIENTILKGVLLSKINQAEKNEIICKYKIDSQLEGIALDDSELTVVLSNLFNNAIESASNSEKKYIDIFTTYKNGKYIIEVSNSFSNFTEDMIPSISKIRFSTKGTGRGYGIYNINKIVNKYKGKINMSVKEDMFNISIEI